MWVGPRADRDDGQDQGEGSRLDRHPVRRSDEGIGASRALNNALRHITEDARIEARLSIDEQTARLEVEDSGPGMTSEELSRAFDRFWQAGSSRSRSGAGLGLPIVRGIVAAHGGVVTLESEPDTGTRFTVIVPRIEGSSEASLSTTSDGRA
jgi:K+-sensing histidine kinase KdpD